MNKSFGSFTNVLFTDKPIMKELDGDRDDK
jgi:hypothetical protein